VIPVKLLVTQMSNSAVKLPTSEQGAVVVYLSIGVIIVIVVVGLSPPAERDLAELSLEQYDLPLPSVAGGGDNRSSVVYALKLSEDNNELSF
jgi:hypothetical protein